MGQGGRAPLGPGRFKPQRNARGPAARSRNPGGSRMTTIDRALTSRRLLGAALGDIDTWRTWLVVLKAAFGRPLDEAELEVFRTVAGDRAPPDHRMRELWAIAGRRSGKSRMAAAVAVYLALFQKHKLAPGEKGVALVLAASVDQARTVFGYVRGFLEASPAL